MMALARFLSSVEIDAVYASPRARARQSAAILSRGQGLEPLIDERLTEIDFGQLEGKSYDEIARTNPELYDRWMNHPTHVKFPEGESFSEMRTRVLESLSEMRERHRNHNVAIVSHGGVHRIILALTLALKDEMIFRLGQDYASLSIVDDYEGECTVRLLNGVLSC